MDTRTGRIYTPEQVARMDESERAFMKRMDLPPTPEQQRRWKVGRNDYCPCGSGKKFKKCCLLRRVTA